MIRSSLVAIALMTIALPAAAQNSHCATLPVNVQVEARGPDNVIPAQLTPRGITCPRGFTSESVGPITRCRQPGSVRLENREPRRDCYAALGLGPVRSPRTGPSRAVSGTRPAGDVRCRRRLRSHAVQQSGVAPCRTGGGAARRSACAEAVAALPSASGYAG